VSGRREIARGIDPKSFTIVIPALNEEDAIGDTIARCLAARARIVDAAGLDDIRIIAVSDGSSDRTAEIAQGFEEVKTIVFDQNRGYGAAIKQGWRQSNSLFLGFLDADGTCDPTYFAEMCRIAVEDSADVVLGSRLGPESKMPRIRRLGNRLYALVLGFFCGRQISDSASGMRVVRRTCLRYLSPLPDGLHFTPSMSARALLNNLRVIEIPMRYEERIGTSKLHVLKDGVQFLRTILGSVLSYRPERFLLLAFSLCALSMILLAASPTEFYFRNARLEEWMIYRFVACFLLGSFGLALLGATALANQMAQFSRRRPDAGMFWPSIAAELFSGRWPFVMMLALLTTSIGFLWPGIVEYATTRHVSLHWSRLAAGAFCLLSMLQTGIFALLVKVVSIWAYQARESSDWDTDDG
jgi:glycosyltransferase involved in cell wall biosynthesis